ncbi:sigma-70 family RNA polymerase sigma factor [Catenuloplanes sp. NPDC051500]|uniref:sigma-70 family RNA polymerase sigma factor n=1 Tax=Catenuloplanes sp. NPDC051500 TaxID=3363959 RepID=UPI00378C87C3
MTTMTALHDTHARDVLRFLRALTRDPDLAEDLLQETMLRAWRHLDTLPDDETGTRRWLLTVARRLVIDAARLRRARPAEVSPVALEWLPSRTDEIGAALAAQAFRTSLSRLSESHRSLLVDLHLHGESMSHIAQRLGLPVGTVKSRAHYAMRALRAGLE